MKAQRIITLCDSCGIEIPANRQHVTINGASYTLDVCDEHMDQYVRPLVDLCARLREVAPVAVLRPACPVCGKSCPSTKSLAFHLRRQHESSIAEAYGTTCPLCGDSFSTSPALGTHVTRSHGVTGGVVEAFARARAS